MSALFIPNLYCSFISLVILGKNQKSFNVQAYDNEGKPILEKFEEYIMADNDDFRCFLMRVDAKGLERVNDFRKKPEIITSLERVIPNEYYQLNAAHLTAIKKGVFWTNV